MARVQADLQKEGAKDKSIYHSVRSVSADQQKKEAKSWFTNLNEWLSALFRPVAWATVGGLAVALLAFGYSFQLQSQLQVIASRIQRDMKVTVRYLIVPTKRICLELTIV